MHSFAPKTRGPRHEGFEFLWACGPPIECDRRFHAMRCVSDLINASDLYGTRSACIQSQREQTKHAPDPECRNVQLSCAGVGQLRRFFDRTRRNPRGGRRAYGEVRPVFQPSADVRLDRVCTSPASLQHLRFLPPRRSADPWSMTQGISSPSLSGKAAHMDIGR